MKHNERLANKKAGASKEFKDKQQIVKERLRKEKLKQRLKHKGKGKKGGRKKKWEIFICDYFCKVWWIIQVR